VQTLGFGTQYVLLFVAHDRRELVHLNVTAHPTAAWVWRQLIAATPWGRVPRYVARDRDAVDGREFVERASGLGIETVLTPIRAPRANAVAERLVGTLRRECLDRVIVLNEAHLRAVLTEYTAFYNAERPHRTLELGTPIQRIRPASGPIRASTVLGGTTPTNESRERTGILRPHSSRRAHRSRARSVDQSSSIAPVLRGASRQRRRAALQRASVRRARRQRGRVTMSAIPGG
jgi:Integrase core domain